MFFFFYNDTATTEIYTLSLHDALPIWICRPFGKYRSKGFARSGGVTGSSSPERLARDFIERGTAKGLDASRSEEHTSELQSLTNLVCRLLLEIKINTTHNDHNQD